MQQNKDFVNAPVIPNVEQPIDRRYVTPEEAHRIAELTVCRLANEKDPDFIDLLDRQLFLVSESLQATFQLYVPRLIWRRVLLISSVASRQTVYWLPIFKAVDCLAEESIQTPDKTAVKKLVLKQAAICNYPLFRVAHKLETIIVARLDAAESILRRDFRGIKLQRVELV
ncbi:hypothetical protein [Lucifera butyrica]|uniref:hypothetical protein n=1 Tax=Lucifera butyrica TaxID=1351585 RepID=UPI00140410F2|nr:hypothetical protein [Lucifera butyrica]